MKTSKFSDSQIMAILNQAEAGHLRQSCAASTASAQRLSTNGGHDLAEWIPP